MKHGKKYRAAAAKFEKLEPKGFDEAAKMVKEVAFAKFDESVDLALHLNLKKSQSVRDTLVLPHQFSAEKKILVFAKGDKAEEAKTAGAAYVGDVELVEKIKEGWLDFDIAVATPDMMKDVGRLGPILGRRGLMPNPKTQTVTFDIKGAIAELRKGRVEYRTDKAGCVNITVGKVSMEPDTIVENVRAVIREIERKRPPDVKGEYIRTATLSSTMGPGVRVSTKKELAKEGR